MGKGEKRFVKIKYLSSEWVQSNYLKRVSLHLVKNFSYFCAIIQTIIYDQCKF
jgi:hypothetical protein